MSETDRPGVPNSQDVKVALRITNQDMAVFCLVRQLDVLCEGPV